MKLLAALWLTALWLAAVATPVAAQIWRIDDVVHGTSLEHNVVGDSPDRAVTVLLPPGYAGSAERYPVVYFLHGAFADHRKWLDERQGGLAFHLDEAAARLYAEGVIRPSILVLPDGAMRYRCNLWCNSPVVGDWEDFVTRDLVAHIDRTYRTLVQPHSRGIAGHSMGGYGAMRLAIRHPEVFGAVYAINGVMGDFVFDRAYLAGLTPIFEALQSVDEVDALGGKSQYWGYIALSLGAFYTPNLDRPPFLIDWPFGVVEGEARETPAWAAAWQAQRIASMVGPYAEQLAQLQPVHFESGTADGLTVDGNRAFDAVLTQAGIEHVYVEHDGNHENRIPEGLVTRVLPFFSGALEHHEPDTPLRVQSFTPAAVVTVAGVATPLHVAVQLASAVPVAALRLDLSGLGVETPVPLVPAGDGSFAADVTVAPAANGQYRLPVRGQTADDDKVLLDIQLRVHPAGGLDLYTEGGAGEWAVTGRRVTAIEPRQGIETHAGAAACAVTVESSFAGWLLDLTPATPVSRFGYEALSLWFHPGDSVVDSSPRLSIAVTPGETVDLLADGVDLARREWQRIEIPLTRLGAGTTLAGVTLAGNSAGTLYLDDVMLVRATPPGLPTAVTERAATPATFELAQSYPNPFNGETTIGFTLTRTAEVELTVYDLAGQRLAELASGPRAAGTHRVRWDGRDGAGRRLASGVYLYRLRAGRLQQTRKLVLIE